MQSGPTFCQVSDLSFLGLDAVSALPPFPDKQGKKISGIPFYCGLEVRLNCTSTISGTQLLGHLHREREREREIDR